MRCKDTKICPLGCQKVQYKSASLPTCFLSMPHPPIRQAMHRYVHTYLKEVPKDSKLSSQAQAKYKSRHIKKHTEGIHNINIEEARKE